VDTLTGIKVFRQVVESESFVAAGERLDISTGIGLAPLPAILFGDPAFKTRLTPLLTDYPLRQSMLYLVYVSRKYLPLKLLIFRDFLVERISQTPEPQPLDLAFHH
jgi:DNA-binding transcriptional LysR family regulator